jgi:large subunit ribosomal protein L6
MSRIGNQTITVPAGVTITQDNRILTVTGPKGSLTLTVPFKITVDVKDSIVTVARVSEDKKVKANHGTTRAHIQNMVTGVVTGWTKDLEIRGTGYKFAGGDNKLTVTAGYINPVLVTAPVGVTFKVSDDSSKVTVMGINKVFVGQTASNIRKIRTPEPYKGKGIRYLNEFIKLKAGKTAKT